MLDLLLPGLVDMFCGSSAEVVSRQFYFLTLSSVFFLVWVLRLEVLSLVVWGVVFLLVLVRCLGKCYSYVGRQIFPSLSLGARARLV